MIKPVLQPHLATSYFQKIPWIALGILFLAWLIISWPLFQAGFFTTHDGNYHVVRLLHLGYEIEQGQFPVRFASQMLYRFGYPVFVYFYPLPHYWAWIIQILTNFEASTSWNVLQAFLTLSSGWSMYYFLRHHFSKLAAVSASVTYLWLPVRLVSLYVTGQIGATLALALAPLILGLLFNYRQTSSFKTGALLAFSLASLVCSHLLSTLVLLPWFLMYLAWLRFNKQQIFKLAGWGVVSLGLASWYLLPSLGQLSLVRLSNGSTTLYWHHFPSLKQLLYSPWGYGYSLEGYQDQMSFQVGLVGIVAVVLASVLSLGKLALSHTKVSFNLIYLLLLGWLLSFSLMLPISNPVWRLVPGLEFVQFPWRFLLLNGLLSSSIVAWSINEAQKKNKWLGFGLAVILLTIAWVNIRNYRRPETNDRYSDQQIEQNTGLFFGTTDTSAEVLPLTVTEIPSGFEPQLLISQTGIIVLSQSKNRSSQQLHELQVHNQTKQEATVELALIHDPHWLVIMDTQKVATFASPRGWLSFSLTPGEHHIIIGLQQTKIEVMANLITIATFIAVGFAKPIYLVVKRSGRLDNSSIKDR